MKTNYQKYADFYHEKLLQDIIPFWEKHSIDKKYGGYLTCLDRDGSVYDTDKFMWLQARQIWMFSKLYNCYENKDKWKEIAHHGMDFLLKYGMDREGNWYYGVDRSGSPLFQPFDIFTDCFAVMALSQYSKMTGDSHIKELAERSYNNFLKKRNNPKGRYSKVYPGTRPFTSLSLRMIHLNLLLEMEWQIGKEVFVQKAESCISDIMKIFLNKDYLLLHENSYKDGTHPDTFEGRIMNPGHALETLWMVTAVALKMRKCDIIDKAEKIIISTVEYGWDKKYGGIFYRKDIKNKPPHRIGPGIEWDQKMWWVHAESLIALALIYSITRSEKCWKWFEKMHSYSWRKYYDSEYGEWFGYLNRRGEKILSLKGGRWKGCFHVPRAVYYCSEIFKNFNDIKNIPVFN